MSRLNLLFIALFVGLLMWISFFEADRVARLQRGTMTIFSPFTRASGNLSAAAAGLGQKKMSYSQLRVAFESAQRERDRLQLEAMQLDELFQENSELRKALQYKMNSSLALLPARVISRKSLNWYNTLIIDKGSADQVRPDYAVIVPVGEGPGLVGKVSEVVGPNSSIVLLLTDEMCQVPAQIQGTVEQGIVNGQRAPLRTRPDLKLRYLSKEALIEPGDVIVSSGVGEVFREGLLLGRVKDAKQGVIDAEATLVPIVDFEKLRDIFIIMPDSKAAQFQTGLSSPKPDRSNQP